MDHDTAIRIQAAERYVLEEFPPEERTEFEEHFFDCPECAEEVRSATIFAVNAKQALSDERARDTAKWQGARQSRRFGWALAVSAVLNLALIAGIGLDRNGGVGKKQAVEPQFYSTIAVARASRGTQSAASLPKGAAFFGVRFDLMPGQQYQSFEYQILDAKGVVRSKRSLAAPAGEASELEMAVPVASLETGEYVLVLRGSQSGNPAEIGRRTFVIPR